MPNEDLPINPIRLKLVVAYFFNKNWPDSGALSRSILGLVRLLGGGVLGGDGSLFQFLDLLLLVCV